MVTTADLAERGIRSQGVTRRLRAGRLHRLHRGVYAVGNPKLSREGQWLAAVLACGNGALLSHLSAAALWGLRDEAPVVIDVTVVAASGHDRARVRIHESRAACINQRARRLGIPVTTVSRTLLDIAGVVGERSLERAVIEAERLHFLDRARVLARCGPGHSGSGRLREIITRELAPAVAAASELELRFLELCRRHHLPAPEVNTFIEGFKVDAYWPEAQLIVELDGRNFHRTPGDRRRDAARDRRLQLAGLLVLRFGWEEVTQGEAQTAEQVRAGLRH